MVPQNLEKKNILQKLVHAAFLATAVFTKWYTIVTAYLVQPNMYYDSRDVSPSNFITKEVQNVSFNEKNVLVNRNPGHDM